jgi:membrane-associated protein
MEKLLDILTQLSKPEVISSNVEYLALIVILYCFVEVFFPPFPGDALLVLSGSLSEYAGVNPFWVIVGAFLGTFSASALLYSLGRRMERRILHSARFAALLDTKTFFRLEKVLNNYGILLILLSRFIPVIRSGIILAAGMVNLNRRHSLTALSVSILASSSLFVLGGRYLGKRWQVFVVYWKLILLALVLAGLIYLLAWKISTYLRNRK